uniref:YEATS domain-containing protein n=1 Tax=Timema genevievae TaxID=629358 RepID=A0A7R9JUR9_TIMGE|nr:unnamed protein product [Timema genevievae]
MLSTLTREDGSTTTNWEEPSGLMMETYLPDDDEEADTEEQRELRGAMTRDMEWQKRWEGSETGRRAHQLFPNVVERIDNAHLEPSPGLVQLITGKGPYPESLRKMGLVETDRCECGECVRVSFEIGHEASLRSKTTVEGFTHDWEVFVKGADNTEIYHFVEKVVFYLHNTFTKPKRVIKDPPYSVKESGYAGFIIPIEIYFKNKDEPKKVRFDYDLNLQSNGPPISKVVREKYVFPNPSEDLRRRLIKGGGVGVVGSEPPPLTAEKSGESSVPIPPLIGKPKLGGSEGPKKHKVKLVVHGLEHGCLHLYARVVGNYLLAPVTTLDRRKAQPPGLIQPEHKPEEPRVSNSFADLFGPPIHKTAKVSPDPKKTTAKTSASTNTPAGGSKPPSDKTGGAGSSKPPRPKDGLERPKDDKKERSKDQRDKIKEKSSSASSNSKHLSPLEKPAPVIAVKTSHDEHEEKKKKDKRVKEDKPSKKDKHKDKEKVKDKEHNKHVEKTPPEKIDKIPVVKEKDKEKESSKKSVKEIIKPPIERNKERDREKEKDKHLSSEKDKDKQRHKHKKKDKKERKEEGKDRDKDKVKSSNKKSENHRSKSKDKERLVQVSEVLPPPVSITVTPIVSKKKSLSPSPPPRASVSPQKRSPLHEKESSPPSTLRPASSRPLKTLFAELTDHDSSDSDTSPSQDEEDKKNIILLEKPPVVAVKTDMNPVKVKPEHKDGSKHKEKKSREKKDKDTSKEDVGKKRKRKSNAKGRIEDEPESKVLKVDDVKKDEDIPKLHVEEVIEADLCSKFEPRIVENQLKLEEDEDATEENVEDTICAPTPETFTPGYVSELMDLQQKIMTLEDNAELQRVVQVIAETGQYEITKKTFDFDLCTLDRRTVKRLQDFFSASS